MIFQGLINRSKEHFAARGGWRFAVLDELYKMRDLWGLRGQRSKNFENFENLYLAYLEGREGGGAVGRGFGGVVCVGARVRIEGGWGCGGSYRSRIRSFGISRTRLVFRKKTSITRWSCASFMQKLRGQ